MEIVKNPLLNHQNQTPVPQPGPNQNPQQPPNVAIILNPDEQVPLPQGRQVWGFDNAHGVQTLSSDPPRVRTLLPPFLNPTPRPFQQPNIRVLFLNPSSPNLNLPFINSSPNQQSKIFPLPPPSQDQQSIIFKIKNQQFFLLPLFSIRMSRRRIWSFVVEGLLIGNPCHPFLQPGQLYSLLTQIRSSITQINLHRTTSSNTWIVLRHRF